MEKTMQKIGLACVVLIGIIGSIVFFKKRSSSVTGKPRWTIGILQTATHPALDDVRKGFMQVLEEKLGKDIAFVVRNGEGTIGNIHAIAQQFHARDSIDAIFAVATPAVQAIASLEKKKPIFIAAVTAPEKLGIMNPKGNICGTSDMTNVEQQIESMRLLLPSLKTVSILFSPSEINSVVVAEKMRDVLLKNGITSHPVAIITQAEISTAVISALSKSDALLAPTDNVVASAITLIADLAHKARKPLIVSDNTLVKFGALMAQGVNYFESGKQTGLIAYEVLLHNKAPYQIPIMFSESKEVFINRQVLQDLGLTIPAALKDRSIVVENERRS
ncbi:ABC transporter substrate-binding protein [Candidatus Dependentiae bacterium]|nr:ABC transporter substrate-binding protein [Candidatus Dependentiae bacterium]